MLGPLLWVGYTLRVPIGGITKIYTIGDYIYKFFLFIIEISSAVAFTMVLYGGVRYIMSGTNAGSKAAAMQKISQALIGLILLLGIFVLLYTLNPQLTELSNMPVNDRVQPPPRVPPTPVTPPQTLPPGVCSGTGAGASCLPTNWLDNLACNPDPSGCGGGLVSTVNSYSSAISAGAASVGQNICGTINTVKMLKAIAANESGGRPGIVASDKQSAGFYQITPSVAKRFASNCGVSISAITDKPDNPATKGVDESRWVWLIRSDTVKAQSCMAALYLKNLSATACGCSVRNLAAGYNGGSGACGVSYDCRVCKVCNSVTTPVKRYECMWNGAAHTTCNAGYVPTRRYVPRVQQCYNIF